MKVVRRATSWVCGNILWRTAKNISPVECNYPPEKTYLMPTPPIEQQRREVTLYCKYVLLDGINAIAPPLGD